LTGVLTEFCRQRYPLAPQSLTAHYLKRPFSLKEDDLFELSLQRETREENAAFKAKHDKGK
jgi:hypothetical protein